MISGTCSSVADCSITMTRGSSLLLFLVYGEPLQPPALVFFQFIRTPRANGVGVRRKSRVLGRARRRASALAGINPARAERKLALRALQRRIPFLFDGQSLQPPALVNDSFEDALDGRGI